MKTNATLNSAMPPDIRTCPAGLRAASAEILRNIVPLMGLHGIATLTATVTQLGARSVIEYDYTTFKGLQPPEALADVQEQAAKALIDYMTLMGIHSVELEPTPEDIKTLEAGYVQLKQETLRISTAASPKSPPVGDPTGVPVDLPEVSE